MTFRHVKDMESLFRLFDNCAGAVYYKAQSGEMTDLRNNAIIQDILLEACRQSGIEEISVSLADRRDVDTMINYLLFRRFPGGCSQPG